MLLELILAQLQAWNNGNLDLMMSYYHDDVKVYAFPAKDPFLDSKATIITHIKADFESGNVEQIKVIDQLEEAPFVLTIEEKSSPEHGTRRGVFTYLIEENKVKALWFERVDNSVNSIPPGYLIRLKTCASVLGGTAK